MYIHIIFVSRVQYLWWVMIIGGYTTQYIADCHSPF